MSDLREKIEYCRANDDKCRKISENAEKLSRELLGREQMLDYLQRITQELNEIVDMSTKQKVPEFNEHELAVVRGPIDKEESKKEVEEREERMED